MLRATIAAATPLGLGVVALHVHHGLSPNADAWLAHCAARCRRWAADGSPVTFAFTKLSSQPARGESVEAWAREARYGALAKLARAHGADLVLLGHHRRDQAETFLLQALRGGGVAGLAAMPRLAHRDGLTWARPWLEMPRERIEAYARAHRLRSIEDESNDDEALARNRLRARVWPALLESFPDAEATLADAARWAQRASAVVLAQAAGDLDTVVVDDGLDLAAWRALPGARQGEALRAFLRRHTAGVPASLVERVLREARVEASQRWPVAGGELRSHRGRLFHVRPAETRSAFGVLIDLGVIGVHPLAGWRGAIRVERATSGGVPVATAHRLQARTRAAGDRFQPATTRPPRSLKLQYQAAGIAPWRRDGPILCCDGQVVFVAGLGIDARAAASPTEAQVMLHWVPEAPAPGDESAG